MREQTGVVTDQPQLWSDEERWQVLMENVKDYGIFMLDAEGRIATWNAGAERLLGYTTDEVLGEPFRTIFTDVDILQDQPQFELREAGEKGRCEDERWHVRKDGTQFWASGVLTPLWAEDGSIRGFAKVVRDITERKLAEIASAEANRRKDEFLAILSHEFRNPLAAIQNALQLIKMDSTSSDVTPQAAAIIERQSGALVHMVDELLDVSRINGGKLQLQRQRVALKEIIGHAIEAAQPMIDSREHQLFVTIPDEAVWLDADPHRLKQVVSNVIVNAAKYTDPGGKIAIAASHEGNQVVVRVQDNGAGILSEMLPRIFEPFVQADRSLDRSQGGLGIGLSLVKRLTEMHGGNVAATSEGIGKGSTFVIRLPALAEIKPPSQTTEAMADAQSQTGLKIVIAEDNQDTAESLALILRKLGHEVTLAKSGTEALRLAGELIPQLMILDIGLPGIDGYQVAQKVRGQDSLRGIQLIAVTGYGQPEDEQRAKQAGFDSHLVKPIDFAKLLKLLIVPR
jgi:PAS domain S-box-containing protein